MITLDVRTDRSLVRAGARSTRYLHVPFVAPVVPPRPDRRPLTVAFALDRSGSMGGEKIRLARTAVKAALRLLRPNDLFSVVVYDDRIDVLVPATRATPEAIRLAAEALSGVDARGSTNLCDGWLRGCEQVAEQASLETIARCFLLSDGLANQGTTDGHVLADRAGQLRREHVVTSTFGVGADFNELLLASMARAGGGNFYYIEHARQIEDTLTSALGEALEVVARRAVVELELPSGVEAEVLHDFRSQVTDRRIRIELEDLVSGQDVSFIVKLRFPLGEPGNRASLRATLSSEDGQISGGTDIAWTYADHAANDAQPRDRQVDRLVADIYAARARRDAVEFNRFGDFDAAAGALRVVSDRIHSYAGDDEALKRIEASLHSEEGTFLVQLDAPSLKQQHNASVQAMRSRDPRGRARRAPKQPK